MTRSSAAHEPSMDEILASIRRIIETGDERTEPVEASRIRPERAPIVERLAGSDEGAGNVVARLTPEPMQEPEAAPEDSQPAEDAAAVAAPQDDEPAEAEAEVASAGAIALEQEEDDLAARLREELAEEDFIDWSALNAALVDEAETRFRTHEDEPLLVTEHEADEARRASEAAAVQAELREADASENRTGSVEPPLAGEEREMPRAPDLAFRAANTDSRRMQDFRAAILDDVTDPRHPDDAPLTSGRTGELVGASFDQLAEAIREGQLRSMEEMAQDLLRPMLQDWLDDNLPKLVERLVREEIERVARGGRR